MDVFCILFPVVLELAVLSVRSHTDIILVSVLDTRVSLSGDSERAAVHYQHAVQLKPSHYVAMVNLARLLRSSNGSKEAEIWYKR